MTDLPTKQQRHAEQILRAHYKRLGELGGAARAANLSKKRRAEIARAGGLAKAKKARQKKVLDKKADAA